MKKSIVLLHLFLVSQWVFAQGNVEYIIREDGVYCDSSGEYRVLEGADPATFVIEIPTVPYAKDRKNVYWNGEKLPDANAATFRRIMNTDYSTDGKGLYFRSEKLYGVDPGSFNVLKPGLGADKHYIYSKASILDSLYADFSYYANFVISGDNIYEEYEDLDVETLEIIRSKNHRAMNKYDEYMNGREEPAHEYFNIYFDDIYHNNRNNLENADPASFVLLNSGYSKDKHAVFFHASIIPEADPATFKRIVGTDYSTDQKHVFFRGKKLESSDGMSFRVLDDDYCLDKNNVYYHGRITGADPGTFKVVSSEYGYPFYPGGEEELKNFIMYHLDLSKYPHVTDKRYTANCWIDTLGKVKQITMDYYDFHNEYSDWAEEIANILYGMPDWQFPVGIKRDSALVAIPLEFIVSNKVIDPDEEYASNEIFKVQLYYPEFPGGISEWERFFTKSLKPLKLDEKDRLTGEVTCRFRVNKDGSVVDDHIVKSLSEPYDNEVLRVIRSQPNWKPGRSRGMPTAGICEVTVFFSGYEVQKQELKRVEFIELYVSALGDCCLSPAEKGYERISKKYRQLNDITIEFEN